MLIDTLPVPNSILVSRILRQAKYDEIIALLTVFLCGLAYMSKGILWERPDPYRHKLYEKPQQRASATSDVHHESDLRKRLEADRCDIAILWASQSGTAERFAVRLTRELRKNFGAAALPLDISDIDPASLAAVPSSKTVIFIASTYGEGDPSDNLHQMWSWLPACTANSLSTLRFVAFGLGNSNYKHYNHVVDVLVRELLRCGAQPLMESGKADDAVGETEEHFLEWKQRVIELFQGTLQYKQQQLRHEPAIKIVADSTIPPSNLYSGSPYANKSSSSLIAAISLPVTETRNLLQDCSERTCLHVELDIGRTSSMKYRTGDHLAIWPVNPAQEVQLLLGALGQENMRDTPIRLESLENSELLIPSPTTLGDILQTYVETCAPVPREAIRALVAYAPTEEARTFLESIGNDKYSYAEYLKSQYLNLGRLLLAACVEPGAWNSIPLTLVLEILPPMRPRHYSISSSSVVSPRKVSITVAVSDTTTSNCPERVIGVATNYLTSIKGGSHPNGLAYSRNGLEQSHVFAAVRKSAFRLPIASNANILMVGAGTGVAPFRGFVQERARLRSVGKPLGTTRLFFGCRNPSQDLLYADEFSQWAETLGKSFEMTTAFSRPDHGRKRYVQDAICDEADAVCKLLIDDNAYFYICGSAAMARDVGSIVAKILMAKMGWDEAQMSEFAHRQKRQKRWLQDVWG